MKATKATIQARVDDILRIRLDGAEFHDVRRYAAEKQAVGEPPWAVPEGEKPLSDRQLWRYVTEANRLMAVSSETSRKKRMRVHLARRKALYARAVNKGDERTALAVLADLAKLEGLYPPAQVKAEHTGAKGGPIHHEVKADHEHHLDADPDRLAAIFRALAEAAPGVPGAPGPAGDAPPDQVHSAQAPPQAGGLPPAQRS